MMTFRQPMESTAPRLDEEVRDDRGLRELEPALLSLIAGGAVNAYIIID